SDGDLAATAGDLDVTLGVGDADITTAGVDADVARGIADFDIAALGVDGDRRLEIGDGDGAFFVVDRDCGFRWNDDFHVHDDLGVAVGGAGGVNLVAVAVLGDFDTSLLAHTFRFGVVPRANFGLSGHADFGGVPGSYGNVAAGPANGDARVG